MIDAKPANGSVRLFLALWPGEATARALRAWRDLWIWPPNASVVRPERLHLTLHFLGDVPVRRLPVVTRGLDVPFEPFELRFGRAAVWPKGVAVLEPFGTSETLQRLHAALGEALERLGLPVEERAFRPHVTFARRATGALAPQDGPALRWRVRSCVLVQSVLGAGGGYRVLARFGGA